MDGLSILKHCAYWPSAAKKSPTFAPANALAANAEAHRRSAPLGHRYAHLYRPRRGLRHWDAALGARRSPKQFDILKTPDAGIVGGQLGQREAHFDPVHLLLGAHISHRHRNVQRGRKRIAYVAAGGEQEAEGEKRQSPHRMYLLRSWSLTISESCDRT